MAGANPTRQVQGKTEAAELKSERGKRRKRNSGKGIGIEQERKKIEGGNNAKK